MREEALLTAKASQTGQRLLGLPLNASELLLRLLLITLDTALLIHDFGYYTEISTKNVRDKRKNVYVEIGTPEPLQL